MTKSPGGAPEIFSYWGPTPGRSNSGDPWNLSWEMLFHSLIVPNLSFSLKLKKIYSSEFQSCQTFDSLPSIKILKYFDACHPEREVACGNNLEGISLKNRDEKLPSVIFLTKENNCFQ